MRKRAKVLKSAVRLPPRSGAIGWGDGHPSTELQPWPAPRIRQGGRRRVAHLMRLGPITFGAWRRQDAEDGTSGSGREETPPGRDRFLAVQPETGRHRA
jgi:hypothetical protein